MKLAAFCGLRHSSSMLLQEHGIPLRQICRKVTISARLQVLLEETVSAAVPVELGDSPS